MDRIEFDLKKQNRKWNKLDKEFIKISDTHWWGAEALNSGPKCEHHTLVLLMHEKPLLM